MKVNYPSNPLIFIKPQHFHLAMKNVKYSFIGLFFHNKN
jgi:hypothetical protein